MNTYKNIDIKNNNIIQKEGILVDLLNISNTSNNICCINMTCNKCYIKAYKTEVNNTGNTNTNTNKPLIDLHTVSNKYNIDGIILFIENLFNINLMPAEIYHLNQIPSIIDYTNILFIVIYTFILTMISAIYPALKASSINPASIFRGNN